MLSEESSSDNETEEPISKRKYRKYVNNIAEVYMDVMHEVIESLTNRFARLDFEVDCLKNLQNRWFEKLQHIKSVDALIEQSKRRRGALSAAERAAAAAKCNRAQVHSMLTKSIVLVKSVQPIVKPVIGPNGQIMKVVCNSPTTGDSCHECRPNNKQHATNFLYRDIQPQWSYPLRAYDLPPEELVLAIFTITMRKMPGTVEKRELKVRIPAAFVQQNILQNLVDPTTLLSLVSMDITTGNAKLLSVVRSALLRERWKKKTSLPQLDGNFSDSECEYSSQSNASMADLNDTSASEANSVASDASWDSENRPTYESDTNDMHSSTSSDTEKTEESLEDSNSSSTGSMISVESLKGSNTANNPKHPRADSLTASGSQSLAQIKGSPDFSTGQQHNEADAENENDIESDDSSSNETEISTPTMAKTLSDIAQIKQIIGDSLETSEIEGEHEEGTPLNSDDDISVDDAVDSDNVIICLYDKVIRRKDVWRVVLRNGVMNIRGEEFVFDTLILLTAF